MSTVSNTGDYLVNNITENPQRPLHERLQLETEKFR